MTPLKNHLKLFFFALLAFTFTACQTGISEAMDDWPTLQFAEPTNDEESPCYGQDPQQGFELDRATVTTTPSALGDPQTVGHLELIPDHSYSVAPLCMCWVDTYVLTFDEYPDPVYSSYTNNAGVEVFPSSVNGITYTDPNTSAVTIIGYEVTFGLTDLDEGVYFGFDDDLDPQPSLVQAGGLCMVDNVGAPDPNSNDRSTGPWTAIVTDRNGFTSRRYALPTTHSSGSHRLIPR